MVSIPEKAKDLFDRPVIASLATLMPGGEPQLTPVWIDYDGQYVRVNTARGRQKDRNLKVGSPVTALLIDPQNPYHWVEVRGHVAEVIGDEKGARAHINQLSHKYRGTDYPAPKNGEYRLMYKIIPDKVN